MRRTDLLVALGLALIGWLGGSAVLGPNTFPPPLPVMGELGDLLLSGALVEAFVGTLARTLASFTLAGGLGLFLGSVMAIPSVLGRSTELLVDFLRSIPAPALLPIFIAALGLYSAPKVAFAIFVAALVIAVYVAYGMRVEMASLRYRWLAMLQPSRRFLLQRVVFPGALPSALAGMRVALSLCLILSTLAEYVLMTGEGLGTSIRISYEDGHTEAMFATILLLGIVGLGLNGAWRLLEAKALAKYQFTDGVSRRPRSW